MRPSDVLVEAYLQRVGLGGVRRSDLDLDVLVAAHLRTIPFETLDPVRGVPVHDLSFEALSAKMVAGRRGGYCFEQNTLFAHVLRALGHRVEQVTGRVVWGSGPGVVPARTHQLSLVTLAGASELLVVDVGFGGQTLPSPISLVADLEQPTRHEPYRLRRDESLAVDGWRLESLVREEWAPLYVFWTDPQPTVDLQMGSWYVSTLPESGFVQHLVAARVTDEARINLADDRLTVHTAAGSRRQQLDGVDGVLAALRDELLLDVDDLPGLRPALARILGV